MRTDDFHRQLVELVRAAAANGVDVRGGWSCESTTDRGTAWAVEITELVRER
jgi:hypothetical protein